MSEIPDFPSITVPDQAASDRAAELRSALPQGFGMPPRALGRLENLGTWIAACQGHTPPRPLENVSLLVISAEHGVAQREPAISTFSPGFAADVREAIESGSSPLVSTARSMDVAVSFIDATSPLTSTENSADRPASGEVDHEDALTSEQLEDCLNYGREIADKHADEGTQLLTLGEASRGLTTVCAAIIGTVCRLEPVKTVGRGSGIDDHAWRTKTAIIRDAQFRVRDDRQDALLILRRIGGADLAVMTGILAQAAVRRTPVLVDGLGTITAALCAQLISPGASAWWQVATAGSEPAISPALKVLHMEPLLDLQLGTGQGLGALLALPMLRHAVDALGYEGSSPQS